MKKTLTTLRALAARALFWRKRAPASVEPGAADEPAQTLPAEAQAPTPKQHETEPDGEPAESKPGLMARLAARVASWRRKPTAQGSADEAPDEPPPAARAKEDTPPSDEETPPRPPLAKRILAVLLKKSVWMPSTALLLVAVSTISSITYMRSQQSQQEQALKKLQAAKFQLERENQKLRKKKNLPPAPEGKDAHEKTTVAANTEEPIPSASETTVDAGARPKASGAASAGGDCLVGDKADVGESLRRCIEGFNAASTRRR